MNTSPAFDLEHLFQEHQRDLLAMLRRMVGCRETAADLAQEAYIRLADVPTSHIITSPRAFLFRTATNLALDHFRKQKFRGQRQASLEEAENVPTDARAIDAQVHDKQLVATLERALATLSDRTRAIFAMRRVYGYSYQEIAAHWQMSERAVEKHLVKAMTRCQEALMDKDVPATDRRGKRGS